MPSPPLYRTRLLTQLCFCALFYFYLRATEHAGQEYCCHGVASPFLELSTGSTPNSFCCHVIAFAYAALAAVRSACPRDVNEGTCRCFPAGVFPKHVVCHLFFCKTVGAIRMHVSEGQERENWVVQKNSFAICTEQTRQGNRSRINTFLFLPFFFFLAQCVGFVQKERVM